MDLLQPSQDAIEKGNLSCDCVDARDRGNVKSAFHPNNALTRPIALATMAEPVRRSADENMSRGPTTMTVIAVDHNPILLEGIAVLIRSQPDMQLLGTASTAGEAVALHLKKSPDIAVIDLELPHSTAFAAIRHILAANPLAKPIGLTTYEFNRSGPEAMAAGVIAVITKDRIGVDLESLIRQAVRLRQ